MVALHGQRPWEIPLNSLDTSAHYLVEEFGRLPNVNVTIAPDGSLWILSNNTDGVGTPSEQDELLLRADTP